MAGHSYLKSMIGKEFKVNRGGHDAVWGKLIDVKSDFLVLDTGEGNGICYFNLKHIKSFNEVIGGQNGQNGNKNGNSNGKITYSSTPDYVHATNFTEVLEKLRPNVVTINRGGPEKIEGVLTDANEDYMIVVVNKDIIRIPTYHVKSISLYTGNNEKNEDKDNKGDAKKDKSSAQSKNKSGGKNDKSGKHNRSSYERSGGDRSEGSHRSSRRGRTRTAYSGREGSRKQAGTRMAGKTKLKARK